MIQGECQLLFLGILLGFFGHHTFQSDDNVIRLFFSPYTHILPLNRKTGCPSVASNTTWKEENVLSISSLDSTNGFFDDFYDILPIFTENASANVLVIDNIASLKSTSLAARSLFDKLLLVSSDKIIFDHSVAYEGIPLASNYFLVQCRHGIKLLIFIRIEKYKSRQAYLDEVVTPTINSYSPHVVILRMFESFNTDEKWHIDDSRIHILLVLSRHFRNSVSRGNHTTTVRMNPYGTKTVTFKWMVDKKRLCTFLNIDQKFASESLTARCPSTKKNRKHFLQNSKAPQSTKKTDRIAFKSQTSVDPFNDLTSHCSKMECRLGNVYADSFESIGMEFQQSKPIDFAFVNSESLFRGWHKGDVYLSQLSSSYRNVGGLHLLKLSGANVWFLIESFLLRIPPRYCDFYALDFVQVSRSIRYTAFKLDASKALRLASIETYDSQVNQWKPLKKYKVYSIVTNTAVASYLLSDEVLEEHKLEITAQDALLNFIRLHRGALDITIDKRIQLLPSAENNIRSAMVMYCRDDCAKNTRWNPMLRSCDRCPTGFHQPLSGQDHCIPRKFFSVLQKRNIGLVVFCVLSASVLVLLGNFMQNFLLRCVKHQKLIVYSKAMRCALRTFMGETQERSTDIYHAYESMCLSQKTSYLLAYESHRFSLERVLKERQLWPEFVAAVNHSNMKTPELQRAGNFLIACFQCNDAYFSLHSMSKYQNSLLAFHHTAVDFIENQEVDLVEFGPCFLSAVVRNDISQRISIKETIIKKYLKSRNIRFCAFFLHFSTSRSDESYLRSSLHNATRDLAFVVKTLLQSPTFDTSWKIIEGDMSEVTTDALRIAGTAYFHYMWIVNLYQVIYSVQAINMHTNCTIINCETIGKLRDLSACYKLLTPKARSTTPVFSKKNSRPATENPTLFNPAHIASVFSSGTCIIVGADNLCWKVSEYCLYKSKFSSVYLGICPLGSLVAVKIIDLTKHEADKKERTPRSILREAFLLRELNHPNIVSFFSSLIHQGKLFVFTEYVPGGTLQHMIDFFTPIHESSVKKCLSDCLSALTYLHSKGIVHGDLKPQNVLIDLNGSFKLNDFGSSIVVGYETLGFTDPLGTPLYMSPEACRGKVFLRSDIWSLGILACVLLTKEVPFLLTEEELQNKQRFIYRIGNDPQHCIDVDGLKMEDDAKSFVKNMLKHIPKERLPASELLHHRFFAPQR